MKKVSLFVAGVVMFSLALPALAQYATDDDGAGSVTIQAACPNLTTLLQKGRPANSRAEVVRLQQFLIDTGYLDLAQPTGSFGLMTHNAVIGFQRDNNLPAYGNVGAQTRAKIAQVCSGSGSTTTPTNTSTAPAISLSASKTSVVPGESVQVSWSAPAANYCSIRANQYGGDKDYNQNMYTYTLQETTLFTVTCVNAQGISAQQQVTVEVVPVSTARTAPTQSNVELRDLINGAVLTTGRFTVNWSGNNTPTYYNLRINNQTITNLTATTWSNTPLSLGLWQGSHTVSVQACNSYGCSPWPASSQASFIVTEDTGVLAVSSAPTSVNVDITRLTNNVALRTGVFKISWSGNNSPTYYNVRVDNQYINNITASSWENTPASLGLLNGLHTVWVQACNARGCSSWPPHPQASFTVTETASAQSNSNTTTNTSATANQTSTIAPSVTITPSTITVGINGYTPTISWSGLNGTSGGYYNYRVNGGSPSTIGTTSSVQNMPRMLGMNVGANTFEVQACVPAGCGAWSTVTLTVTSGSEMGTGSGSAASATTNTGTANTATAVAAPTLSSVVISKATITLDENLYVIFWGNSSPTYWKYRLSVNGNSGSVLQTTTGQLYATPRSIGLPVGSYVIYVQACNTGGCSSESSGSFTVADVLGASTVCTDIQSPMLYNEITDSKTNGEVSMLQRFLVSKGLLASVTGYYGRLTSEAVMAYQEAKGIQSTGYVGTLTKASIVKDSCQ